MPEYSYDPTKVSVSFDVLPKGEYEFEIGTAKPFLRQAGEDKHDSHGVRFNLKCVREDLQSKKVQPYSCYMQSEGAQSFTKQFLMAALGYGNNAAEEKRFNEAMAGKDWSYDPDSGAVGSAYTAAVGSRIVGTLDVNKNKDGSDQQQFKGWRTILSGAPSN